MQSGRRLRIRLLLLGGAAVAVVGLAAYAFVGRGAESADTLRALPEASLNYPGSEVISSGGRDAASTIVGPGSAFAWRLLGADATPEQIHEFYDTQLTERGWVSDTSTSSSISATGELPIAYAWVKDGVIFRLGIRDPDSWRSDPDLFARYRSVYDARLIVDRRAAR